MPTRYFETTVAGEGYYLGDRTWSGEQINVAWAKMDYNSSNFSLWALDASGHLQYRSQYADYAGRYNPDDIPMTDYNFDVTIQPAGSGNYEAGFTFRFKDRYSFYYLVMNGGYQNWNGNNIRLRKVTGSTHYTMKEVASPVFNTAKDYHFKVVLKGGNIKIWLDDVLIIDHTDPLPIPNGAWGPWVKGQEFTKWKFITAKSISKFSAQVKLPMSDVTNDNLTPATSKLIDPRKVGDIVDGAIKEVLNSSTYDTYGIYRYRLSSSVGRVKTIFDKTFDMTTTTDSKSLIYAYQEAATVVPTNPVNFRVIAVGNDYATYTWDHADDSEDGFIIMNEQNKVVAMVGENVLSYTERRLLEGTMYKRKVVAYNPAGNSIDSNIATFTTTETIPLEPQDFGGEAIDDKSIKWSWTDNSYNERQFELIKWDKDGNITVVAAVSRGITEYIETNLQSDTEYTRGVRASNTAGASSPSLPFTVRTKAALPDPPWMEPANFFGVGISDDSILWYWEDTTNNETGFELLDVDGNVVAVIASDTNNFVEKGLNPSTIYQRKIRAFNDGGPGPSTTVATAKTLGLGENYEDRPVAPINLTSEVHGTREASIYWEYNDHPLLPAYGFKVYMYDGTFMIALPVDYREFRFTDLQPNRTYRLYIVAYNENGDSAKSNVTTFMTPHVYDPYLPTPDLTELPDPYAGILYEEETEELGAVEAFQSGVGDNLHLQVMNLPERQNTERFTYNLFVRAKYDVLEPWYPEHEILYQVTCIGVDARTGAPYEQKSSWIKGKINGAEGYPDGKKPFISSIGMRVAPTVVNRKYSVEVTNLEGNVIPMYNPLNPDAIIKWTISEDTDPDQDINLGSLDVSKIDIFNQWGRFSHNSSNAQPAKESETHSWIYNDEDGSIRSTINSETHIGFYSKEETDDYELDVSFHVEDPPGGWQDNDRIGVVIAFKKDANGREHTLTALRNNDSVAFTWSIYYNYARSDQKRIADASAIIKKVDVWGNSPLGSRIKIVRKKDSIEAWTSQMNSQVLVENSKLTVDLSSDPVLAIFKDACNYGISCHSQQWVVFDNIKLTNFTARFVTGTKSTLVAWSDDLGERTVVKTWRSALIKGKMFEIKDNQKMLFADRVQVPTYDLVWQELRKNYELYGYSIVVVPDNPNTDVILDVEVVDFFPEGKEYIDLTLKARVVNGAQTAWHPNIHSGYYYLNQREHFLYVDDKVRVKDAKVQSATMFDFQYMIEARGRRYYKDMDMNFTDDSKQEFLQGTLGTGITLDAYQDAISLDKGITEAVFISRVLDYLNTVGTWHNIEVVQDDTMAKNGAILKLEIGIADATGAVTEWFEQKIGQPVSLPSEASRIRYRLTLKEGKHKKDFIKKIFHTYDRLRLGMVNSDKITVVENSIELLTPEINRQGRFVSTTMDYGTLINDMGVVKMGIYIGENSKVRLYSASSDDAKHDFTNPTATSPWIPLEVLTKEGELHTFRNRAARRQYNAIIIELERGEIQLESGMTDYSTPVVYDISVEPNLYEYERSIPIVHNVSIGGFAPAGYATENYDIALIGKLDTNGQIHAITENTVEDIVLDYLASIGITNLNELSFSQYNLKWDQSYPINLMTNPTGIEPVMGMAYDSVGDIIEQNTIAQFDKDEHNVFVSPIPQNGSPVIVKNARNQLLRPVNFRDKNGRPTLKNQEYLTTNETRYIFLQHKGIDPESLRVWIDLNRDGVWSQQVNCLVAENRLILPNLYEEGLPMQVQYILKDSFYVNYNHSPEQDIAEIRVHTDFNEKYAETRKLDITYEVDKRTPFYSAKEIDLNPLRTRLNSGFLYLTDTVYPPFKLEVDINPVGLYKTKPDAVVINARILDEFYNPVVGEVIQFSTDVGSIVTKERRSDHNGIVTAIFQSPQNVGEKVANINVKVLAKNLKYQLTKDIKVDLIEEKFVEKVAIIPDKTEIARGETIIVRVVAMGHNDERMPNKTINVSSTFGEVIPPIGITNGQGEMFFYFTPPVTASTTSELSLITADTVDEFGNLIQEQALLNVLKTNSVEVSS